MPKYSYYTVINKNEENPTYKTEVKLNDFKLPIKKGDTVGTLEVYKDDEKKPIANIPLIAQNNVTNLFKSILNNKIVKFIISALAGVLGLIVLFILLVLLRKKIRRNKRRNYVYNKKKNIYSNKKIFTQIKT
ncbi:penicillin-binding 5, C-terminal domain protein [[Clostridium] sordellii ATCC 9714]|nr:penicillin-binding 5, C-terminal domain protein [[Clostridium] sordellii ATCC 9714] [Paeniclostridium sordellii ATCC 9714]